MRSTRNVAMVVAGVCLFAGAEVLRAEPIILETFTGYPDNALISASPAGPALGLVGDWVLDTPSDFYVNKTQADDDAGTGKAVYDRPADHNGARQATRSTSAEHVLFSEDGDLFYASFLVDPARWDGRMTFELRLERLDDGGISSFSFGIIDGVFAVGNGGVDINVSGGTVTSAEQLVVVRVEYGDTSTGPDDLEVVTVWVDPVDESSPPVIDAVSTDFLNSGGGKILSVSIRGDQMFGSPAFFDNLRVGFAFEDVVPQPVPAASAGVLGALAVSLGVLGVLRLRRRAALAR